MLNASPTNPVATLEGENISLMVNLCHVVYVGVCPGSRDTLLCGWGVVLREGLTCTAVAIPLGML